MCGKVPLGILSEKLNAGAKDYLSDAESLIRNAKAGPKQVRLPTYFLLSHALELSLKAYLAAHGVGIDQLIDYGHNLQAAYDRAIGLGFQIDDDRVLKLVRIFTDFHREMVFRYPVINRDGDLVIICTLLDAAEVFEVIIAIWHKIQNDVLKSRLDAVQGGKYPVEEWHMA